MQLIIVNDIGIQKILSLPSGTELKPQDNNENHSKNERIARMLAAQGKHEEINRSNFVNYIESGYFYVTSSGEEYLKMGLNDFWKFIEVCNALSMIDAGEQGFYSVNVYYPKVKESYNSDGQTNSKEINLDSFIIHDPDGGPSYNSTVGEICTCLARGILRVPSDLTKYV